MKLEFIIFTLLFKLYSCKFPFPLISEKDLYVIQEIGFNETFEISFYKPTLINKANIYFYENINKIKYLPGWKQYEYYIIESGSLYQSEYSSTNINDKFIANVPFNHNIYLKNSSYGKHVYVDPGVKLEYKVWSTNNTKYDGSKFIILE